MAGETLNINTPGNTITLDVDTVQIVTPEGGGGADLGETIATGVGAAVTQFLFGGEGPGTTGINKGQSKILQGLLGPVTKQLTEGFGGILKSIEDNITGTRFGGGAASVVQGTAAQAQALTAEGFDPFALGLDATKLPGTIKDLRNLGGAFQSLIKNTKDSDESLNKLAQIFNVLEARGVPTDTISDFIKQEARAAGDIDSITQKLLGLAKTSGAFAKDFGLSIGTSSAAIQDFRKDLTFLGPGATREAQKLAAVANRLGVEISQIFTKRLITFDEAANFGADLGVLLGGINIDLNDFVNALPSERIEMGFGEIADAIDEGRLKISEDGAKFGQQVELFAQQLNVDAQSAEKLLRIGRQQGGEGIRKVLQEGFLGRELGTDELSNLLGQTVRLDEARTEPARRITGERAEGIAVDRESAIGTIRRLTELFESRGVLEQLAPFAEAITKFEEIAKTFGKEGEGAAQGLVRGGLLAGLGAGELIGEFQQKTSAAGDQFATTLSNLQEQINSAGDLLAGMATKISKANIGETLESRGAGGAAGEIAKTIVEAFKSPAVTEAIADSMKRAGYKAAGEAVPAALNGTNINGEGTR